MAKAETTFAGSVEATSQLSPLLESLRLWTMHHDPSMVYHNFPPTKKKIHTLEWIFLILLNQYYISLPNLGSPIWRFPEIGLPLNHLYFSGISHYKNHPAMGGTPVLGTPHGPFPAICPPKSRGSERSASSPRWIARAWARESPGPPGLICKGFQMGQ